MKLIALPAGVDFTSGWNALYGAFTAAVGTQFALGMSMFGVGLLVFALVKFFWDKRKGTGGGLGGAGGGLSPLGWTLVFATLMVAPGILVPVFLRICELIADFGMALIKPVGG